MKFTFSQSFILVLSGMAAIAVLAISHLAFNFPFDHTNPQNEPGYRDALWTSVAVSIPFVVTVINDIRRALQKIFHKSTKKLEWFMNANLKSHIILRATPLLIIFLPNLCLLLYQSRTPLNMRFAVGICQMLLCTQILIVEDMVAATSTNRFVKLCHTFQAIANIIAFFLFWFVKIQRFHEQHTIPLLALTLHITAVFGYPLVAYFSCCSRSLLPSYNDELDEKHNGNFPRDLLSHLPEITWQRLLYSIYVSAIWIVHFYSKNHQSIDGSLEGELDWYLYALAGVSVLIGASFGSSLRDKLDITKMAAELNKVFVRFISHELRSHISHLTLGLEMLDDYIDAPSRQNAVAELKESCEETLQVLNDIVVFDDISRFDKPAGINYAKELLDVPALLRGIVAESDALAVSKLFIVRFFKISLLDH